MMNQTGPRRILPDQWSGSGHTFGTPRHPRIKDPILSKRVCFYKSGDPQFNGLRMVINNRTFKTFDALLDSLSNKVPLPFGVRNITTPRGVHAIYTLDELEDGKSYICSDSRKVKPINLALARKKLPPWYHARPVSSRRRTVQQARFFPGHKMYKRDPVTVRTPKKLLIFRNGDPTVKQTVVLHKRTTPTFESILEYISEMMQFHVVKLHTADGRRVDGLPGLILCSGTVVAAGREPFRSANYTVQKSPAPAWLPTNRMGLRRLKSLKRKKKPLLFGQGKSRNFSPSSERYIVNRIRNSLAESCDLPSMPTNSVELESSRMLESVAETEGDTCLGDGAEGQGCLLPSEDDIEKSFRVNQDGSMTVEMRVRLTIKEEETIHWTTTLSRSSVASQLNASCFPEPEVEQEICSLESNSVDKSLQSSAASTDSINKDKTKDNNDEDPPSLSNGAFSESSNEEEDNMKIQTDVMSPWRAPTPGHKQIRQKQTSVESITSLMAEGIQEDVIGSYSYKEQTENGAMTEQYCVVKQSTTRPVPKPRRLGSVDANINSRNITTIKSAGMAEILQIDSSGEEVSETVLHMYEQQTCQDNFLANICARSMSASGMSFGRPATSETGRLSCSNEFEPELWRPSTASESIHTWRTENKSVTSDLTLPSQKTDAIQATNRQHQFPKSTRGKDKHQKRDNKDKRVSPKPKVINRRVRRLLTPGKRPKEISADATETDRKVKTFSSAGFIKRIYGGKSKSAVNMMKVKKRPTQKGDGGVTTKSLQSLDDKYIPSQLKENSNETVSFETSRLTVSSTEVSQPRGILTRQTSMNHDTKNENKSCDISKTMSLPAVNSSSSVTNEYVESWLEKAHIEPTTYPVEESKKLESAIPVQTENDRCGESVYNCGLIADAEEGKCLQEKSEIQPCQTVKSHPPSEELVGASVKLRIQCFENKSSHPSVEKTTMTQQGETTHSYATTTNTEICTSVAQNNTEVTSPSPNRACSEMDPAIMKTSTDMLSGTAVENESSPIQISLQNASPSNTVSMELPLPPPPPAEITELSNTEYGMVSSVASSPLYGVSSVSSQMSDNHPLSISPTSDKTISPTDHAMETISDQTDIPSVQRETPLPRTPSIKRAALISNLSLERKMSLRKACLDKYTCTDATTDMTTSSTPINIVGNDDSVLPDDICSVEAQPPPEKKQQSNSISELESSQSCCISASPTSLTSEEGMTSDSISSLDTPSPNEIPFKGTKTTEKILLTQKEVSSPKPMVKKGKGISSLSPDRKSQTKKFSSELSNDSPKLPSKHNHHSDKTMSPIIGRKGSSVANTSPSTEAKKMLYQPKLQKRPSPYSQSLDMVSPPVKHRSNRKTLSRNLSSENTPEPPNKAQKKASSQRKHQQTPQSKKQAETPAGETDENEAESTDDLTNTDQEKYVTETQLMPQPLNTANQPNMKPVLEKICYSIKSIRQITQNKRPSCLEKSNSLPDFSSHVASTFGSSSKALLAFLSVMTLKEGITNSNMDELNANNVSCAEALKMIDALREIASIEDSHTLNASLSSLQQSASKQLLQSWRGFQELSKSRTPTPNCSEQEHLSEASAQEEENVIDEIMDSFNIPKRLKEELASLHQATKAEDSYGVAKSEINDEHISEERQLYSTVLFVEEDGEDVSSCKDAESPEVDSNELQSEESMSLPENQLTSGDEMSPDEERQNISSAIKDEEKQSSLLGTSSSEAAEQHSDSHSEEEEDKQQNSNYYVEVNVDRKESISSPDSVNQSMSEEEQTEIPKPRVGLNISVDKSISNSDLAPPSAGQPKVKCKELKVIEEEGSIEEEEEHHVEPAHKEERKKPEQLHALIEETEEEEEKVTSDDEEAHSDQKHSSNSESENTIDRDESNLTKNENSSLTKSESYKFNADEDSGNDHSSCEEQIELELQEVAGKQISSSAEEELSYCEKEFSSGVEEARMDRYTRESCKEYQESSVLATQSEVTTCEEAVEKNQPEEIISQSVAERISLLQKQGVDARRRTSVAEDPAIRRVSQKHSHQESDVETSPSESPTSQSTLCTRSAPQSSLSFSYDSSGVVTTEPEGNRVKSIREMFLAKNTTDVQQGRRFPSPNTSSELSKFRAETSASAGYQSQTSSELSSGEEDSARKSITKGFVRRTIERLYGKKDTTPEEEVCERPPSAPKLKKKEQTSIFSPFHIARSKAVSELSYFNSSNALDSFNEATRCIAFNAQVGPGDSVPIDSGRWLLRENTLIRKSVSDPVGINKAFTNSPKGEGMCKDTEQNTPYSLFSTESELEDKTKSFSRKCTYFSLPHGSDSDVCQDDLSTASKGSVNGDSVVDTKDNSEDAKTWAERNGTLPTAGITDFKMKDNKVHPLVEVPPDGEVVVVQPGKGQGAMHMRLQEPDMLDFLYNFCGQHCPIL